MNPHPPLLSALAEITGTGHFHSAGTAPFFFPRLHVKGLDEIAFPLPAAQAAELIALAEAAPFGMGTRTVLDESIRKCWQIDAAATHDFRRPQGERTEIENFIRQHILDLDFVTVRKGTPHTLACTKNANSYHHALALRAKDQALLAKLTNLSREGPRRA